MTTALLTKQQDRYVLLCNPAHRKKVLEEAGAQAHTLCWDKIGNYYFTYSPTTASKFRQYAQNKTELSLRAFEALRSRSEATTTEKALKSPPNGLSYLPYQKAGIEFLIDNPRCLLGDEAGTGKTIQAAGLINELEDLNSVLIICPASLRLNWEQELDKWLNKKPEILDIVSYDSVWRKKNFPAIYAKNHELVIFDEAHMVKNGEVKKNKNKNSKNKFSMVKRTQACILLTKRAKRFVAMTGTPLPNRPIEIFSLLNMLDEKAWPDRFQFAMRYCGAFQQEIWASRRKKLVWNLNGASRLDELQDKLRSTLMIRRLRADVLPQLPKKRRQVIQVENKLGCVKEEVRKWEKICSDIGYEEAVEHLENGTGIAFSEMSEIRKQVALEKAPIVIEHVRNLLDSEKKVVIFAHHRDCVQKLFEGLEEFNPVKYMGGMTDKQKNEAKIKFQESDDCRVFIGNIQAAGVGLTLTAASVVVFAELSQVPAMMSQAEDRCARIGATADFILVQHIILQGSLDVQLCEMLIKKQEVSDRALDKR